MTEIQPDDVIESVCDYFGFQSDELLRETRQHFLSKARKIAAYLLRKICGLHYKKIANIFLRDDHTTGMYWVKWGESQESCPWFRDAIDAICHSLLFKKFGPQTDRWSVEQTVIETQNLRISEQSMSEWT